MTIADIRTEYRLQSLAEDDVAADPTAQFAKWFEEAVNAAVIEPNAMCLATATPDAYPSARMVLLKGFDARGFVFYTNYESRKGHQLTDNPQAALLFLWKTLREQVQVKIEGTVEPVSVVEADEYFASRPRPSQVGAWASIQSQTLDARETFEARITAFETKFEGSDVPRPPHWSGFRVVPETSPMPLTLWVPARRLANCQ
jgi:pyridoxamine 5'-phosphate oxidase